MFNWEAAQGAPITAAIIIGIAVFLLGGISFVFRGSVQF